MLLAGACSRETPAPGAGEPALAPRLVPVGPAEPERLQALGAGRDAPRVRVRRVVGALDLRPTQPLGAHTRLRFRPFLAAGAPEGTRLRLVARRDGEWEELADLRPERLGRGDADALGLLERDAQVDLDRFAGTRPQLRFEVSAAGGSGVASLATLSLVPGDPPAPLPSILLICSDTHRLDFSLTDEGPGLMPRLGALRAEGVLFRRAFAAASWTLPSVTSLLTGLYPRQHGAGENRGVSRADAPEAAHPPPGTFAAPWKDFVVHLSAYSERNDTLPELLRRAGYETLLVSANPFYVLSGLAQDGHDVVVPATAAPAHRLVAAGEALLSHLPPDRPVFLSIHATDVHDWARRDLPDGDAYAGPAQRVRAAYARAVRRFDAGLGELLDAWDARPASAGSLVIFYSDHGEHLFDPGHPPLAEALAAQPTALPESLRRLAVPVLGHGNSMQESLLRVPLVLRFPRALGLAGRSVDAPVSLVDVLPTVLELISAPVPGLPGRSLLETLRQGEAAPERALFADFELYGARLASVRRGSAKLVLDLDTQASELREVCLDCRPDGDPGRPLAAPALRDELLTRLREHAREAEHAGAGRPAPEAPLEPGAAEQLRALGYAE